jgi:lactate dehydrogenase-like 2-hydroxyacid dehydrogenase
VNEGERLNKEAFREALEDKDGVLLAGGEVVDEQTITGLTKLKAVCVSAAGYNKVDVKALTQAGIIATNAPGPADETVADFTWGLLIAAARKLTEGERYVREGNWKGSAGTLFFGIDVHGKTLGIIGMGRIGQAIARRAAGFNMKVIYYNRTRLKTSIEETYRASYKTKTALLQEADFIVLSLPYTKANHHIIANDDLRQMKEKAVLVNIARGGLIDEASLAEALQQKRIAAAALDVFEAEPKVHPLLLTLPNVILTPHIAGGTERAQHGLARVAADNLVAALGHGENAFHPPAILNPEVLNKNL